MSFAAKLEGKCKKCQGPIYREQLIEGRERRYSHVACPPPSDICCLMCDKPCVDQKVDAVLGITAYDSEMDFMIDYDRGCPTGCECDGQFYHLRDFCSEMCVVEAIIQFEKEAKNELGS